MKIALIGPTYPFRGGIAHYTTLLCRALRQRHEVLFISFTRQYPRWLFPGQSDRDPSRAPLTVAVVHYLIDGVNPLTWSAAWQEMYCFRPELVVFQWWTAFWMPLSWYLAGMIRRRLPDAEIAMICHNAREHEHHALKSLAAKRVLAMAHRILTHSCQDAATLTHLLGPRVPVIPAFLPTYRELGEHVYTQSQAKTQLGLRGAVLLFFGFVRAYKGLHILLDALPLILKEQPVHLLIVGEFWEDKQKYLDQIQRVGVESSVTIIDRYLPNEELGLYFAAADLVVQPYLTASGSAACQLAFGFDRPVIATRVGSLPEVIEDGVNGRLVPPGDAPALAAAILESLQPEALQRLSLNAASTKERFSWATMAAMVTGEQFTC